MGSWLLFQEGCHLSMKRLSFRFTMVFGIMVFISCVIVDSLLIFTYYKKELKQLEDNIQKNGNIIASFRAYYGDSLELMDLVNRYEENMSGRILILNDDGEVIIDSQDILVGELISNKEIRKTQETKTMASGYYYSNGKKMLMMTIPVFQPVGTYYRELNYRDGMVLISVYVQDVIENVWDYGKKVLEFSLIIWIAIIILSCWAGYCVEKPVKKLIDASKRILEGDLKVQVNIDRKDEIGILAKTFNQMCRQLDFIESNRRTFISNVSHELKTPLASIQALIESLDENDSIETYQEYLADISKEVNRLSKLVQSLLTVSRLEEIKLDKEYIPIKDFVNEIIKQISALSRDKKIEWYNECDENIEILADRNGLKEVMINLMDNSIRYGKENGFIKIYTQKEDSYLILGVADNGIGIPEESQEHIFDNFYTVNRSRARKQGGSGVGLYIVKKIIDLHRWEIKIESDIDQGTDIQIFLKDFRVV